MLKGNAIRYFLYAVPDDIKSKIGNFPEVLKELNQLIKYASLGKIAEERLEQSSRLTGEGEDSVEDVMFKAGDTVRIRKDFYNQGQKDPGYNDGMLKFAGMKVTIESVFNKKKRWYYIVEDDRGNVWSHNMLEEYIIPQPRKDLLKSDMRVECKDSKKPYYYFETIERFYTKDGTFNFPLKWFNDELTSTHYSLTDIIEIWDGDTLIARRNEVDKKFTALEIKAENLKKELDDVLNDIKNYKK